MDADVAEPMPDGSRPAGTDRAAACRHADFWNDRDRCQATRTSQPPRRCAVHDLREEAGQESTTSSGTPFSAASAACSSSDGAGRLGHEQQQAIVVSEPTAGAVVKQQREEQRADLQGLAWRLAGGSPAARGERGASGCNSAGVPTLATPDARDDRQTGANAAPPQLCVVSVRPTPGRHESRWAR